MKDNATITIYYIGDANSTMYECRTTTLKTFKKWREESNRKLRDVAFILLGRHKTLHGFQIQNYIQTNDLKKYSLYDI